MQPRSLHAITMDHEPEGKAVTPSTRGRHNSKLKVLVRSHAMREETSPPREPSPSHLISPCIKVIPSPESSLACSPPNPHPLAMLSPSLSRVGSPCRSSACVSPTSTLVPSPGSRCSPIHSFTQTPSSEHDRHEPMMMMMTMDNSETNDASSQASSPKYLNKLNKQNTEDSKRDAASHLNSSCSSSKKKYICDCPTTNCPKCTRNQERSSSLNNNHTSVNNNVVTNSNTLTVSRASARGKLRQQSSSQGSFEGSSSNSPCLSRDSSSEQYTDTTGVDLELFIAETVNRNYKDQNFMLRVEKDLVSLAKNKEKTHFKFPPMSSYQRMLVHRCAAYFGMDHNIEATGKCVVVNKTKCTRIPEVPFKEHIKEGSVFTEEPRRSILKRDSNSIEDYGFKSPDRQFGLENRRSKSYEERAEQYDKAKRRIFNSRDEIHNASSIDDFEWSSEFPWSSTESENASRFRLQLPETNRRQIGKLYKVLSEDPGEPQRPCVAKSYSFGGYGGTLHRGDSVMSSQSACPRLLTKQDSAASSLSWRLSPSSSGYKSQSQLSAESITPSPTSTPHPVHESTRQDSNSNSSCESVSQEKPAEERKVVWVACDVESVPAGSRIVNPNTYRYFKNEDGSDYLFDPENPPSGITMPPKVAPTPKKKGNSNSKEKKNNGHTRDRPPSPNKQRAFSRPPPCHNNSHFYVTTSTSPMPYSTPFSSPVCPTLHPAPQMQLSRVYPSYGPPGVLEGIPHMPPQQLQMYHPGFTASPSQENLPVYQPQCVVYTTPYGLPPQPYDGRMDPPPPPTDCFVQDGCPPPGVTTYQQQPAYWNQQNTIPFYPNGQGSNSIPPQAQRFSVPIQQQGQSGYLPLPPPNCPPSTQGSPTGSEIVQMYPQPPVQMVYSGPNVVYTQSPAYSGPNSMFPAAPPLPPPQNMSSYPSNAPTPGAFQPQCPPGVHGDASMMQLTQNMSQLGFGPPAPMGPPTGYQHHNPHHPGYRNESPMFEPRQKGGGGPKFYAGGSHGNTETNSPATSVVPAYYSGPPNAAGVACNRLAIEAPPNAVFNCGPNYGGPPPPSSYRPDGSIVMSTSGTSRSSRSPTPASEPQHYERPRMPLQPTFYTGLPYLVHQDNRMIPGRGQPNVFRFPPPTRQQSLPDNRQHNRNRKSKGKPAGPPPNPPNGKPS